MNRLTTILSKLFTKIQDVNTNETHAASVTVIGYDSISIQDKVNSVCQRIAPLWPLDAFVAVSPYFGLRDLNFEKANEMLGRVAKTSLPLFVTRRVNFAHHITDIGGLFAPRKTPCQHHSGM